MSVPVLILRPEPGAAATAARATALGLQVLVRPLFAAHALDWTPPDPALFDAVMLTSANAARLGGAALERYRHLPVYAVGSATAKAARDAGFAMVVTGDRDAAALVPLIAAAGCTHVLHLAGRDRATAAPAPFAVATVEVYASEACAAPAMPRRAVALLHSPRAAARFAALVDERAGVALVAISPRTAEAAGSGWRHIAIAGTPSDTAMLALAASLCEMRA